MEDALIEELASVQEHRAPADPALEHRVARLAAPVEVELLRRRLVVADAEVGGGGTAQHDGVGRRVVHALAEAVVERLRAERRDLAEIEQADGPTGHPATSPKAASERITARSSAVGWNG